MFTVEAIIDEQGNVKILQPIPLQGTRRALVIVLDEPALPIAETALLSEAALAKDWLRPEEEEAWSYLKPVTEQYLKNLQGSLKGKGGLKVLIDERRKDKERE